MDSKIEVSLLNELHKRLLYVRNHTLMSPVSDTDTLEALREIVNIQLSLINYLNNSNSNFVTKAEEVYQGDWAFDRF